MRRIDGRHRLGLALFVLASLAAGTAPAAARPDTRDMTCQALKDLVQRSGSIVLSTGPNTYDRYVATRSDCKQFNARLQPAWVPARDGKCVLQQCGTIRSSDGTR